MPPTETLTVRGMNFHKALGKWVSEEFFTPYGNVTFTLESSADSASTARWYLDFDVAEGESHRGSWLGARSYDTPQECLDQLDMMLRFTAALLARPPFRFEVDGKAASQEQFEARLLGALSHPGGGT